jgi:ankyrin repeat protein
MACVYGMPSLFQVILERVCHGTSGDVQNGQGKTAIGLSAAFGNVDTLEKLLEHGASADESEELVHNALHAATLHGHEDAVRLLLERGADPYKEGDCGSSPISLAFDLKHDSVVEMLVRLKQPQGTEQLDDIMSKAAWYGYTNILDLSLKSAKLDEKITSRTLFPFCSNLKTYFE